MGASPKFGPAPAILGTWLFLIEQFLRLRDLRLRKKNILRLHGFSVGTLSFGR
jgi:hypothetical protein